MRKLKVQEDSLRGKQGAIMVKKTRGMLVVGAFMIFGVATLNSWYYGSVAARLPFTPWGMFQGITHYGIENNDMTLCSITFIFVLSNLSLGTYLKKFLSFEGPRIANPATEVPQWLK